jgi:hypothetical protein
MPLFPNVLAGKQRLFFLEFVHVRESWAAPGKQLLYPKRGNLA